MRILNWCIMMVGIVRALRVPGGSTRRAGRRNRGKRIERGIASFEEVQSYILPRSGIIQDGIEWQRQHVATVKFAGMDQIEIDTRRIDQKAEKETWLRLRKDLIATTSEFAAACFDSHLHYSRDSLLEAKVSGRPLLSKMTPAIQFGLNNEHLALQQYRRDTGHKVSTTGLWTDSTCRFGASPDAIVQDAETTGLLEIKCLYSRRNKPVMPNWDFCPDRFYAQIQGQLYITGAAFCDLMAWIPRNSKNRPNYTVVRVLPDTSYHNLIKVKLQTFANDLFKLKKNSKSLLAADKPAGSFVFS